MRKRGWYNFQSWGDVFRYHRAKAVAKRLREIAEGMSE